MNDRSRARRLRRAFEACEAGDFDTLVALLSDPEIFGEMPLSEERTLCINATDSAIKEQTFLHLAAYYGHLDIAQLFCSFPEEAGLDIEAVDWHGMTPLLLAAQKNNIAVAQVILRRGGDPEKTDKFGRSMLLFSKYPTVHTLLVTSRTDRVEETAASLKWADEVERDLNNGRIVVQEHNEIALMHNEEVRKKWVNSIRKYRSMQRRLDAAWSDTNKANHGVVDARNVLQEEVDRRDEAVAKSKQVANTTVDIIDVYHTCHVRMTLAKQKHDRLVRKRAEVRALAASKVGIVDAMKRLAPLSISAQSFCALALRVVTASNSIECAKVVVRGGVEGLLSSMARFPSNVVIQREGCSALANLVQLNAYAREELNKFGGIRIVFSALRFLKDSANTQASGMRLLCGLIGSLEINNEDASAAQLEQEKHIQPGSREWEEMERAKALVDGAEPDAQADRNAAIQVASFASPLITSIFKTFGFEQKMQGNANGGHFTSATITNNNINNASFHPQETKNDEGKNSGAGGAGGESATKKILRKKKKNNKYKTVPKLNFSISALKMAAQALYGLTKHGLHSVVEETIVPLCHCIAPLVQPSKSHDEWDPHPNNCASTDVLDFLRFAMGALHNISESSQTMREQTLSSTTHGGGHGGGGGGGGGHGGSHVPELVAHCMRCCTAWTGTLVERADMMQRDPLAFVKGGRTGLVEPPEDIALRLQQLQLHCCLLMSSLTQVPDEAVRKTMVREGGFEGALYALQYVGEAHMSKPLGEQTKEHIITALKAGSVRSCYCLLLGVRGGGWVVVGGGCDDSVALF